MSIGISEDQFWRSNPKILEPYVIAHEIRVKEQDALHHNLGKYYYVATVVALDKMFNGKKATTDYPDIPFMQEKHLEDTVGAKQLAVDRFFAEQDAARQKWKMKRIAMQQKQ